MLEELIVSLEIPFWKLLLQENVSWKNICLVGNEYRHCDECEDTNFFYDWQRDSFHQINFAQGFWIVKEITKLQAEFCIRSLGLPCNFEKLDTVYILNLALICRMHWSVSYPGRQKKGRIDSIHRKTCWIQIWTYWSSSTSRHGENCRYIEFSISIFQHHHIVVH